MATFLSPPSFPLVFFYPMCPTLSVPPVLDFFLSAPHRRSFSLRGGYLAMLIYAHKTTPLRCLLYGKRGRFATFGARGAGGGGAAVTGPGVLGGL